MYYSKHYNKVIEKKALLIGINYANDRNNQLRGAIADARNLESLFSLHGFDCHGLLETAATKVGIISNLETLAAASHETDRIVISFSGHGTYQPDTDGDELDGRDEMICTYDGDVITDDELNAILLKFSPFCKVLILMDCCHSGTNVDLPIRYLTEDCVYVENKVAPVADVLMLSGCKDTQTSTDVNNGNDAYGVFTHSFIANHNLFHSIFEMLSNIKRECKAYSGQTPQMSSSRLLRPDTKITDYLY